MLRASNGSCITGRGAKGDAERGLLRVNLHRGVGDFDGLLNRTDGHFQIQRRRTVHQKPNVGYGGLGEACGRCHNLVGPRRELREGVDTQGVGGRRAFKTRIGFLHSHGRARDGEAGGVSHGAAQRTERLGADRSGQRGKHEKKHQTSLHKALLSGMAAAGGAARALFSRF